MLRKLALILWLSLPLAGCAALGGRSTAPLPEAPTAFTTWSPELAPEPVRETRWWTRFGDPVLSDLIEQALTENRDVREAVARVEAARSLRREAHQGLFPTGGLLAAHEERQRGEVEAFGGERRTEASSAGLQVGWELDLFGRVRNAGRASQARLEGTEALLSQTRLVLAAEVARTWFALRGSEGRLRLLERYRDDQAALVEIVQARFEEGLGDATDLARARTVLAEDEAALAAERHTARVLRHALAVLVARPPGGWAPPATAELGPPALEKIAIGDPAELLRRRPDVRAAERALAAETAEIGIATAGLFPQVRLGGFLGFVAGGVGDLADSGSSSWSVGPTITWGLFDLGRVRAQIHRSKAEAEASLATYEQTVLRALEDAQNAFSTLAAAQETLGATDSQVRNARQAAEQIEARYREGASGYFELLDARRAAVRAEIARADSLAGHRIATVDVFRALGSAPETP
jgi:multidrug efflux system outer membrane protein